MTDKLTTLTANVARLLDGALALPTDADRERAFGELAGALAVEAFNALPAEVLQSDAFLKAILSEEAFGMFGALMSSLTAAAAAPVDELAALDSLAIPDEDMAARVVDREVSFDDGADCEGCKI